MRSSSPPTSNVFVLFMIRLCPSISSTAMPFVQWGVDLVGALPRGTGDVRYVIVAINYFTKLVEAATLATEVGSLQRGLDRGAALHLIDLLDHAPESDRGDPLCFMLRLRGKGTRRDLHLRHDSLRGDLRSRMQQKSFGGRAPSRT
ncbi:unnamed protein product [Cuscuta campestris]|uniref:Uncharacterized protein n=1 Tax=Cuscuta campestris TaxID=132261 RepID=A0A484N672_9ASTE|nr:unnamed protein product [Cuscuta campestris]